MKIFCPIGCRSMQELFKGHSLTSNDEEFFKSPKSFNAILFVGGEDVSPKYYGERKMWNTGSNLERDETEKIYFDYAYKNNVASIGICRGAQFLSVMLGGKLVQHLDGHFGNHLMRTSINESLIVSSVHHQMIIPHKNIKVIGWSSQKLSERYLTAKGGIDVEYEVEAIVAPNVFGVQYHPEFMELHTKGVEWFLNSLKEFLSNQSAFIKKYGGKECLKKMVS